MTPLFAETLALSQTQSSTVSEQRSQSLDTTDAEPRLRATQAALQFTPTQQAAIPGHKLLVALVMFVKVMCCTSEGHGGTGIVDGKPETGFKLQRCKYLNIEYETDSAGTERLFGLVGNPYPSS